MNRKLRLLVTEECIRSCEKCCNKNFDMKSLPVCTDFSGYDTIMLTGGEPLLLGQSLVDLCYAIRTENPQAKIYIYTSFIGVLAFNKLMSLFKLRLIDGVTYTIHDKNCAMQFSALKINMNAEHVMGKINLNEFSLRVKSFIPLNLTLNKYWQTCANATWVDNCPLPEGEDFMRLK